MQTRLADVSLPERAARHRPGSCFDAGPRTFYVHLSWGEVAEVEAVRCAHVTATHLVLDRADRDDVVIPRRDVYFACCRPESPPPAC